jgi:hypothetical protein
MLRKFEVGDLVYVHISKKAYTLKMTAKPCIYKVIKLQSATATLQVSTHQGCSTRVYRCTKGA